MEWHFEASDAKRALAARADFRDYLTASCTVDSDVDAAELVFGELVCNVVHHATGQIDILTRTSENGSVRLCVRDCGPGFDLVPSLPKADSECGRGVYIVSRICRDVWLVAGAPGTTVSAVLPVRAKLAVLHDEDAERYA